MRAKAPAASADPEPQKGAGAPGLEEALRGSRWSHNHKEGGGRCRDIAVGMGDPSRYMNDHAACRRQSGNSLTLHGTEDYFPVEHDECFLPRLRVHGYTAAWEHLVEEERKDSLCLGTGQRERDEIIHDAHRAFLSCSDDLHRWFLVAHSSFFLDKPMAPRTHDSSCRLCLSWQSRPLPCLS